MNCTAEQMKGWEQYPENIGCDELYGDICNCSRYRKELEDDASRLFDESEVYMRVIEIGRREIAIGDPPTLEDYLLKTPGSGIIRVFLIHQEWSWSPIGITYDSMRKLLTSLRTYARFLDVLRAFGQKTEANNDSFSAFNIQRHAHNGSLEISYIVKHVELHGRKREDPNDLWSPRQIGVYHRLERDSSASIIIVNPSKTFFLRLRELSSSGKLKTSWDVQMLLISCTTYQWKWYLSHLEERLASKKRKAQLSKVSEAWVKTSTASLTDLQFADVQDIQVLQDQSLQTCQLLEIDSELLKLLEENGLGSSDDRKALQPIMREMAEQTRRAQVIIRRVEGVLGLVKSLLDFRCLETSNHCLRELKINGELMNEMTYATQQENRTLLELSHKAAWDTDILKTITFLTLIYLPASFATSLMDMDYIKVQVGNGIRFLKFEPEFYFFLCTTVILWILTLGSYFWWFRTQKAARARDVNPRWR